MNDEFVCMPVEDAISRLQSKGYAVHVDYSLPVGKKAIIGDIALVVRLQIIDSAAYITASHFWKKCCPSS